MTTTAKIEAGATQQRGAEPQAAIDELCINTIRTLAIDAVQRAQSGHPGAPMGLAPVMYTLWQRFLRYDPDDPAWPNRDRFVLSNGHASMLLYATLHLAGVKDFVRDSPAVSLEDIKAFRQLGSKCPGHPEHRVTAGVETTTGPLGQGCAASVGMAIASHWLARHYNRPDFTLFDHDVYVLCGDGDMMEGVSSEAASLAGHLKLGNLCWVYDNNGITIEGHTSLAFSEDLGARFAAYGWRVRRVFDANNIDEIAAALADFGDEADAPTLLIVDSHIGYGAPHKQDTSAAHGEPLGAEEARLAKRSYGWPEDAQFLVPAGVPERFAAKSGRRGRELHAAWTERLAAYRLRYPDLARQLDIMAFAELPAGWDQSLPAFPADPKGIATREASGTVLNAIAAHYPWLIGGSADLAPSTKTRLHRDDDGDLEDNNPGGRNLHFGIREHAMGGVLNGLALSRLRPFGSTFLVFCDYMKPAIRLSALMQLPTLYIFTHNSVGLGEDGPTHQPVEQLVALRSIPGLVTLRPADANEVVEAWRTMVTIKDRPACLVLSRQALPTLDRSRYASAAGLSRGAYILADPEDQQPEVILIGTGSEVAICVAAHESLAREGIPSRVVSMPSWELFEQQDAAYRNSILLPASTARVSVEAGSVIGWDRYVGTSGAKIGMRSFGASAPAADLAVEFGFTPAAIVSAAKAQIDGMHAPQTERRS